MKLAIISAILGLISSGTVAGKEACPECDVCALLFNETSDFMQKCGSGMSNIMLMKLMETCYANMDSLDHFMTFLDNLELVCYQKNDEYFEKEWCKCVDCLLIEDPTQPIWEDCIKNLSDSEKIQFRHDCLDVGDDENGMAQFQQELSDVCYSKTGRNVTFPHCAACSRQDVCMVFSIDSSDSLGDSIFKLELESIRKFVQTFGNNIGPGKTQIALLQFSYTIIFELSLCDNADQNTVNSSLAHILSQRIGGASDIADSLSEITRNMKSCCTGDNKHKYGIVLTDGHSCVGETQMGVDYTPADITLIAIGFGDVNDEMLDILTRNITEHKLRVETVDDLNSVVKSLMDLIGC